MVAVFLLGEGFVYSHAGTALQPWLSAIFPQHARAESSSSRGQTLFGLTPFPYDASEDAVVKVHELVAANGNIYALHFDDGIPWREALADKPWPAKLRADWAHWKRRIPPAQKIYLGLAPLAIDRETLAKASPGSSLPSAWNMLEPDHAEVMTAYLNYARRAVAHFQPDFLNIGIEAGNLASNAPERWAGFERLFEHVRAGLKRQWPHLPIGISITLQDLMRPGVAERVRPVIEASDYLGLSFYPYGSTAWERRMGTALANPPRRWRWPLAWVRRYTDKPIAICETGYTTQSFRLQAYGLELSGDPSIQAQYLADLGRIARAESYPFVIWFLAVDYDRLYQKLSDPDGTLRLWRNIGLWDGALHPKPAWSVWQALVKGDDPLPISVEEPEPTPGLALGIEHGICGFVVQAADQIRVEEDGPRPEARSVRWSYTYVPDRWQWCSLAVDPEALKDRHSLACWFRSDREGAVFVRVEERGGERFFAIVRVGLEWQRWRISWEALSVDPSTEQDGHLDPGEVSRVMIADGAALLPETRGRRTLWLTPIVFE